MKTYLVCYLLIAWALVIEVSCAGGSGGGAAAGAPADTTPTPTTPATPTVTDFTLTSIAASEGSSDGGTTVSITGTQFTAPTSVTVGGIACGTASLVSATSISCITGSGGVAGLSDLVVTIGSYVHTLVGAFNNLISRRTFVDGNTESGLNFDSTKGAGPPFLVSFASKLYSTWIEVESVGVHVRVSVYNGNDAAPAWAFVDGNTSVGINYNSANSAETPRLTEFNSKLYLSWSEGTGATYKIRIAVYNGNDSAPSWTLVDGNGVNGINKNAGYNAISGARLVILNSKLYAIWSELFTDRVAVYNGNDSSPSWAFVDGNGAAGIERVATLGGVSPSGVAFNSKVYVSWAENGGRPTSQIRVLVYNGNDSSPSWSFVDGNLASGINYDINRNASAPFLYSFHSKLYCIFQEEINGGANSGIRVAVYNGNDSSPSWTIVDGSPTNGLNQGTTGSSYRQSLISFSSKLYAVWYENTSGQPEQIRISRYGGNDSSPSWGLIDGGVVNVGWNRSTSKSAISPSAVQHNSKIYIGWTEKNSSNVYQVRVTVLK